MGATSIESLADPALPKEQEDEKHVHPLQLDVIDRAITLWSNPGETVLTPFMGVGSEVYGALLTGRRAVGIELKASYYRQAERNIEAALRAWQEGAGGQIELLGSESGTEPT